MTRPKYANKQDSEYIGQFYADIEMQTRQESDKFSCRMKTFFFSPPIQ